MSPHSLLFFHSELGEAAFSDYVTVHAILLFSLQPIERRKDWTWKTWSVARSDLPFQRTQLSPLLLNSNIFVHSFRSVRIYLFRLSFPRLFRDMCILTSRKSWTMRYEAVQHRCCFWPMIFMILDLVYLSVSGEMYSILRDDFEERNKRA